jgi:hypothetical protein
MSTKKTADGDWVRTPTSPTESSTDGSTPSDNRQSDQVLEGIPARQLTVLGPLVGL